MTPELFSLENLFTAWEGFRKGKQNKPEVLFFERHLEDHLFALHHDLITRTYRHQSYTTFSICDPKFRIINKAALRDRIVHHLAFRYLEMLFTPSFIRQSTSCQKGKGIHFALADVGRALRKASCNYTRNVWSLKMDIQKFFASLDQGILRSLLRKRVHNSGMMWLLEEVIQSYSSPGALGKGVPIGSLTSQIFANIYLAPLDHFSKHTMRSHFYFRYADDCAL